MVALHETVELGVFLEVLLVLDQRWYAPRCVSAWNKDPVSGVIGV